MEWDNGGTSDFVDQTDYNQQYEEAIKNTFGDDFDFSKIYVFSTTINGVKQYHFALKSDVESGDGFTKAYTYQTGTYTKSEERAGCALEFGQDGRITRIGFPDDPSNPTAWTYVDVVATETTDTNAYNDAMAEYEYQQFLYDKKQTELDAKTEEIQQQDRNLELKLQRLDSERKQITAEIDALKEVIKTNIDNSFKTFSG
jgi:hypothetical protein